MKYVGYLAALGIALLGVRWAIRNGLQEPPDLPSTTTRSSYIEKRF